MASLPRGRENATNNLHLLNSPLHIPKNQF